MAGLYPGIFGLSSGLDLPFTNIQGGLSQYRVFLAKRSFLIWPDSVKYQDNSPVKG
jgi:hypothetical protein